MNEDSQWLADRQYYVYFYFYYILNIKRLRNRYAEAYILFSGSVAYHIKIKIFGSLFHFPQSCRYFKRNVYKIEKNGTDADIGEINRNWLFTLDFLHLLDFIVTDTVWEIRFSKHFVDDLWSLVWFLIATHIPSYSYRGGC